MSTLKQQTLLEITICDRLAQMSQMSLRADQAQGGASSAVHSQESEHDEAVTLLACFAYPPYLNQNILDIVLKM